jgi:hypothetical protein
VQPSAEEDLPDLEGDDADAGNDMEKVDWC